MNKTTRTIPPETGADLAFHRQGGVELDKGTFHSRGCGGPALGIFLDFKGFLL